MQLPGWREGEKKKDSLAAGNVNTLQHTETHCNTLQHTATLTLQHTATRMQLRGGREGAHGSLDAGAKEEDGDGVSEEGEGSDQNVSQ